MAFGRKKKQKQQTSPSGDARRSGQSRYGDGYDRYDDEYDDRYGRRYDDRYEGRPDDRYGDDNRRRRSQGRPDDEYGYDSDEYGYGSDEYGYDASDYGDDEYSDEQHEEYDARPRNRRSQYHADEHRAPEGGDRSSQSRQPADGEEPAEDDWAKRWSSWVPEDAFKDEDDSDDDLEESEFGEEYVEGEPRKRQNLPLEARTREMAETFVDRFRHGGTVGSRTKTNRIVKMQAISESDIPTIKKRLRRSNIPYNILMVFFALLIIGPSIGLYSYFRSLAQNDIQMDAITAQYTRPIAQVPSDIETVQVNETDMPPIVDFKGLQEVNGEVSSWLRVPGTTIDYPVMTTTVEAKYLRLDIEGNYSIPGCLFTDWDNSPELDTEDHIVIYGHHLPWPAMFHDMSLYLEEPGFVDSHRKMYFETPTKTYVLKVIGIHKAKPEEWQARQTIFNDHKEFQEYIDARIAANDVYDSQDYDRKTINKFFTFITCTDSGSARCIVNAVPVEEYPTDYVPLVRAKMQGFVKTDGSIDSDKEAQHQAEQAQQEQQEQQEGEQPQGGGDGVEG